MKGTAEALRVQSAFRSWLARQTVRKLILHNMRLLEEEGKPPDGEASRLGSAAKNLQAAVRRRCCRGPLPAKASRYPDAEGHESDKQTVVHEHAGNQNLHPKDESSWVWKPDLIEWSKFKKGDSVESEPFTCKGIRGLSLQLYPAGDEECAPDCMSLYLKGPPGVLVRAAFCVDGEREAFDDMEPLPFGFSEMMTSRSLYSSIVVELLEIGHGYHWNLPDLPWSDMQKGESIESALFTCMGVEWWVAIYPCGNSRSTDGFAALSLCGPEDVLVKFSLTLIVPGWGEGEDEIIKTRRTTSGLFPASFSFDNFIPRQAKYSRIEVEILEVKPVCNYVWNLSHLEWSSSKLESPFFTCNGLKNLQLVVYPSGTFRQVFLRGPEGVLVDFSIGIDGEWKRLDLQSIGASVGKGWRRHSQSNSNAEAATTRKVEVQVHQWRDGFDWSIPGRQVHNIRRGDAIKSGLHRCGGSDWQVLLYPKGTHGSRLGHCALFLVTNWPSHLSHIWRISVDGSTRTLTKASTDESAGWRNFCPVQPNYSMVRVIGLPRRAAPPSLALGEAVLAAEIARISHAASCAKITAGDTRMAREERQGVAQAAHDYVRSQLQRAEEELKVQQLRIADVEAARSRAEDERRAVEFVLREAEVGKREEVDRLLQVRRRV